MCSRVWEIWYRLSIDVVRSYLGGGEMMVERHWVSFSQTPSEDLFEGEIVNHRQRLM